MPVDRVWPITYEHGQAVSGGWWEHPHEYVFEAWERMTYGGAFAVDMKLHVPFVTTVFASGHRHTEYLAYAAR